MHDRGKGVKGFLNKIIDGGIDAGAIEDYKRDIVKCSLHFQILVRTTSGRLVGNIPENGIIT